MALLSGLFGQKRTLREEVSEILKRLNDPVSEAESREGWDAELKKKWHSWFSNLDRQLESRKWSETHVCTARAMDFDGVGRTKLSNLAAGIDNRLNAGDRY